MNLRFLRFKFIFFLFLFSNFISITSLGYLHATHFVKKPPFSKRVFISPPPKIEYFSFGYEGSLSGLFWIRLIQDMGVCGPSRIQKSELKKWILEKKESGNSYEEEIASSFPLDLLLENQIRHQKKKSVKKRDNENFSKVYENFFKNQDFQNEKGIQRETKNLSRLIAATAAKNQELSTVCVMGWVFRMLDAITKLVPKYYIAYSVGASSLSVLVDDPLGAKVIFDRGIENFPKDWRILYRAAYHYLYELFDTDRASELLKRAGENGAPKWVFSLASRLRTEEGKLHLALIVLEDFKRNLKDKKQREKIQKKIDSFRSEMIKIRKDRLFKKSNSS